MNKRTLNYARGLISDSIYKSASLRGLGMSDPRVMSLEKEVLYILNMEKAWNFLLENMDHEINSNLLKKYNEIITGCISGERYNSDALAKLSDSLIKLEIIRDPEVRALKTYCYIVRSGVFTKCNEEVALLVANKILLEADKGVLQVPIDLLDMYREISTGYFKSGDDSELFYFLQKTCIWRVNNELQ